MRAVAALIGLALWSLASSLLALLVGDESTTYTNSVTISSEKPLAGKFTALATGTLETLEYRAVGTQNATSIRLGIFSASGGETNEPFEVLAQGTVVGKPANPEWVKVTGLSLAVTAGTVYWLVVLPEGGSSITKTAAASGGTSVRLGANAIPGELKATTWGVDKATGPMMFAGKGTETASGHPVTIF
jgi:hypothetical protein